MARTKQFWIDLIQPYVDVASWTASAFAEWLGFRDLSIGIIMYFDDVLDKFKADVDERLATKQPATLPWYGQIAREYQHGDTLMVDNGIVKYGVIDESLQIVTHVCQREVAGNIIMKVARTVAGVVSQLTTPQLTGFITYMTARKAPGTLLSIGSLAPEDLKYTGTANFNPLIPEATMQASIDTAVELYRDTFTDSEFGGVFRVNDFIGKLEEISGLYINTLTVEWWDGSGWVAISPSLELPAGYFNWNGASGIALTSL